MTDSDILNATPTGEGQSQEGASPAMTFKVGDREYTADAAVTKIQNADEHIQKLERENAEMRENLKAAKSVDDILDAMKSQASGQDDTSTSNTTQQPSDDVDLVSLVDSRIAAKTAAEKAAENRIAAGQQLIDMFGDKVKEVIAKKGEDLHLGPKTMQELAEKSPKAFVALFKGDAPAPSGTAPTTTDINTQAAAADHSRDAPQQGTRAWYKQLQKDNPRMWKSTKIQTQMMKDAQENPDKFFAEG